MVCYVVHLLLSKLFIVISYPASSRTLSNLKRARLLICCIGCSGRKPIDHIWAVSNQAGVEETKAALNLIASTVSAMLLGPDAVQVGVAPRSGVEKAEIRLNDHDTHGQFFNDLELRELSGALTDRAIEYIRTTGRN